jgi:hypothetical protein
MNLEQLYKILVQQGLQIPFEEFAKLPKEQIQQLAEQVQGTQESPQEQQSGGQEEQMEQPQQMQQPQMKYGGRMKYQFSGFLGNPNITSNNSTNSNGTGFLANNPNNPLSGMNGGAGMMNGLDNANSGMGSGSLSSSDDNVTPKGNTTSKYSGLGNIAGQFGAGIAQTAGNLISTNSKPDQAGAFAGNMIGGAGQGAAAGMAFGPIGAAIGGGLGLVSGLVKSIGDKKNYTQGLRDKQDNEVRHLGSLTNSYNPELKRGGYVNSNSGTLSTSSKGIRLENGKVQRFFNEKYQVGGIVPNLQKGDDGSADAEIEGGEAVIGNPQDVTMYGGASAEHSSPVGFMANGANHGQENEGGSEGIPLMSNSELYIGSKKLGLNGKNAKQGNPSVATVMKPLLKYAANAQDTKDMYKRNPQALNAIQNELSKIQQMAEEGKFMENLHKQLGKKDRNYQDVIDYIKQENPNDFGKNPNDFGTPGQSNNTQEQQPQQDMQLNQDMQYKYGGIHINPANKGKFTQAANRAGEGVQEYAHNVMANSSNPVMRKRAQFAINSTHFKHSNGGYTGRYMYQMGDTVPPVIDNTGNPYMYKTAQNAYEPYAIPQYDVNSPNTIDKRKPLTQSNSGQLGLTPEQEAYKQRGANFIDARNQYNKDVTDYTNYQKDYNMLNGLYKQVRNDAPSMGKMQNRDLPINPNAPKKPVKPTYNYGGMMNHKGMMNRMKYQAGDEYTPLKQSFNDRMADEQAANTVYETNIPEITVRPEPTYTTNNPGAYKYIDNATRQGINETQAVDRKLRERATTKMGIAPSIVDKAQSYQGKYNPNAKVLEQYSNEGDFDVTRSEMNVEPDYDNINHTNSTTNINRQAEGKSSASHSSLADAEMSDPYNFMQKWNDVRTKPLYGNVGGTNSQARPAPLSTDANGKQAIHEDVKNAFRTFGHNDEEINSWENTPREELYKNKRFMEAAAKDYQQQLGTSTKKGGSEGDYMETSNQVLNTFKQRGKSGLTDEIDDMIRESKGNLTDGQRKYIQGVALKKGIGKNANEVGRNKLNPVGIEYEYANNTPNSTVQSSMNPGTKMSFGEAFAYAKANKQPTFTFNGETKLTPYHPDYGKLTKSTGTGKTQGIVGNAGTAGTSTTKTTNNYAPKQVVKKTYNVPKKANGGHLNLGQRVRFAHGGRMYNGTVNYYNPQTGDFDIE